MARLEKATGRKVTLTIPQNYAAVVEAMVQGQVDVAHLGGFTFVQASQRAGAVPLVQRDRDREFHSKFITARDDVRSLADLEGQALRLRRRELDVRAPDARLLHAQGGRGSVGRGPGHLHRRARRDGARGGRAPRRRRRARRGGLGSAHAGGEDRSDEGPRLLDHAAVRRLRLGRPEGPRPVRSRGRSPTRSSRWTRASPRTGPSSSSSRRRGATWPSTLRRTRPLREAAVREGLLK